jgi:hypothetical protein
MLVGIFGWFTQCAQMLGIKYACSMKKNDEDKK